MTCTETEFFTWLERFAAHCPWETVSIWAYRQPEGNLTFTAYAQGDSQQGLDTAFGHGATPQKAVEEFMRQNPDRSIESRRKAKIEELEREVARLKRIQFSLPPYKPTPILGEGLIARVDPDAPIDV